VVAAIVVLVAAVLLRPGAPVGHWRSAEAQDRYLAAYARAFTDLPSPAETLDVRTSYGIVRVYRFAGADRGVAPLVLLPGTASGSPVWADNLPSLLRIGDVYTLDLLGEPGMSVQSRPIRSAADQASWLAEVLDSLPGDQMHLIGLSIGGWTAANLAVHDATHVASLTVIDPVNLFGTIPLGTALRAIPASVPWLPKSWRDDFGSYTAGGAPVEDVPVATMIEAGMQGYAMRLPQPAALDPHRVAGLPVPVLAVLAGRSVMHHPADAVATAEGALGRDRVRVYPDASHAINGEYPLQLATDVARFVS
jgi:pimeloyl-ACP methyl ester carboxylesterase